MNIDEFSQKPVYLASKSDVIQGENETEPGGFKTTFIGLHLNPIPFTHQLLTRGQDLANE